LKNPITIKRGGAVAQGGGPKFKPQYLKKKKELFMTAIVYVYRFLFLRM
jgi:hypothetical protein